MSLVLTPNACCIAVSAGMIVVWASANASAPIARTASVTLWCCRAACSFIDPDVRSKAEASLRYVIHVSESGRSPPVRAHGSSHEGHLAAARAVWTPVGQLTGIGHAERRVAGGRAHARRRRAV